MLDLKKLGYVIGLGLLAVFLQSGLLHAILPGGVPNLCLAMTVCIGFLEPSALGAVLAFLLGLELDLASASLLGPWAGAFSLVFGALASLSQRLFVESRPAIALVAFVATVVGDSIAMLLRSPSNVFDSIGGWGSIVLIEGGYTALAAPFVYALMRKVLAARKDSRRGRSGLLMA
jgi:rod shape-determining protein MreD